MSFIVENAYQVMSLGQQKLEASAHNIANASTSGYKSYAIDSFDVTPDARNQSRRISNDAAVHLANNMAQGDLVRTGNQLDIAISGAGMFLVRGGDAMFYTRQGDFSLSPEGHIVNAQGFVLQSEDGDLAISGQKLEIMPDGIVLEDDVPIARIPIFAPVDDGEQAGGGWNRLEAVSGAIFRAGESGMREVDEPVLRQGFLESSNVSATTEMVRMMAALREAEAGAKLVQVYDELMGQAISTFGQS
ncbi:MAG: flagellar hook basal-body protein [Pseudomonadota bacterium]